MVPSPCATTFPQCFDLFPAVENDWHGGEPSSRSISPGFFPMASRTSSGLTALMSRVSRNESGKFSR